MFQNKKLKRNATYAIAEVAEVALCASNCALPNSGKWVANSSAKSILSEIPKCDLATNISEIAIGSEPMPDSKALGVVWDVENDKLKVNLNKNSVDVTTRRQMASQLASYFDLLGMIAPCILGGKLILQSVAQAKFD